MAFQCYRPVIRLRTSLQQPLFSYLRAAQETYGQTDVVHLFALHPHPCSSLSLLPTILIMIAGLLIFPLGFGSTFFRHYCGDFASAYDTGHCLIGWSYMLGIMGTALSVFCPFLSQFTDMRARDIFS
ncbi:hypothetical protein BaRGS_00038566 [Batillaria attramentaria]|uniref:Uncharacterized protein n=1 Tax=Batillaria attramentaria TaxID=370345 RepID=A0ABD0J5Q5_9CAEN